MAYGSNIRTGHKITDCPTILTGGGAGLKLGENIVVPKDTDDRVDTELYSDFQAHEFESPIVSSAVLTLRQDPRNYVPPCYPDRAATATSPMPRLSRREDVKLGQK